MTISELLQYCMSKPGAEQSVHSDWKATQIKVGDVLFAMVKEVEGRPAASLFFAPGRAGRAWRLRTSGRFEICLPAAAASRLARGSPSRRS